MRRQASRRVCNRRFIRSCLVVDGDDVRLVSVADASSVGSDVNGRDVLVLLLVSKGIVVYRLALHCSDSHKAWAAGPPPLPSASRIIANLALRLCRMDGWSLPDRFYTKARLMTHRRTSQRPAP